VAERRRTTTKQFSLRVGAAIFADLERRARGTAASRNALAERYIAEGVRLDEHAQIRFRDGALGRRAALAGTRLDVWQVIATLRESENSVAATAEYLDLPVTKVEAAVRYYALYRDEVDQVAELEADAAARAEAEWRAQQAVLAG